MTSPGSCSSAKKALSWDEASKILHVGHVVAQLRAEGHTIDDATLTLTTPLMRKPLNPFGRYHFDLEPMRQTLRWMPRCYSAAVDVTLSGHLRADATSTHTTGTPAGRRSRFTPAWPSDGWRAPVGPRSESGSYPTAAAAGGRPRPIHFQFHP